jgi:gliding motility-associated-like protein
LDTTIVIDHILGPVANFEANSYNVASNTIFTLTDVSDARGLPIRVWNWDMGDDNTQTGRIVYYTYPKTGDYRVLLEVIDENLCTDTISKVIHIYEELNVFIPNMFTPNDDGLNDTWKPIMSEYIKEGYQLSVFDRWGQRIFHTTDVDATWDGTVKGKKVAPNTTYSYRLIVRDFTGQEYEFVGHVSVIE